MRNKNLPGIFLDKELFKHINADTAEVRAGNQSCMAQLLCEPSNELLCNRLTSLTPQIARKLMLPVSSKLRGFWCAPVLSLGPVVGVLTLPNKNNSPYPSGKKAKVYKELINFGHKNGVFIYFFYPEGLEKGEKTIRGYSWTNNGSRIKGHYPIPDIVYNRILSRNSEGQKQISRMLKDIDKDDGIYLFNTRFLDKWEVHEALSKYQEASSILPDTKPFNMENLKYFTTKYREVFLKPRKSSKGQGIVKIIIGSGEYYYATAGSRVVHWNKCTNLPSLYHKLLNFNARENNHLLQEGVNLAKYSGNIFDLRTQYQKDGQNKWVFTGTGVRAAGRGRFVTHIPNGGRALSYEHVMEKVFSSSIKPWLDSQLQNIGQMVPDILERELGLNLGILSLDIGIDTNGKMFILEVNSKPASFDEDEIRNRHLDHLVNYFIYLGEKKSKRNGFYEY